MQANYTERISLINLLPKYSSELLCTLCAEFFEILQLTPEELSKRKAGISEGDYVWEPEETKDFNISNHMLKLLKMLITMGYKELDEQKKLTKEYMTTYEKFIKI
jgi:hypothetical protein